MPSHNDRRARQGVWSHWVPLIVTVTVATAGLAAWAWSQRKDEHEGAHQEDHIPDLDYENADYGDNPPYGANNRDLAQQKPGNIPPQHSAADENYGVTNVPGGDPNANWGARMSGALRRTPSPQQFFDSTGRTVVAGVAAAGAAMGKALASIREDDKYPTGDNPWSEEADAKKDRGTVPTSSGDKRRRTVAIVVSADTPLGDIDEDPSHEHASILSHIPKHIDFARVKLFVLIYSPSLKETGTDANTSNLPPPSLSSSFSNIGHDQAQTPGEETKSPVLDATNSAFNAVYSQALGLVEKETMILPFTTPNGHIHILRHLQPEIIYLQESLSGDNGSIITNMQTWLRHDVVLVVGAESGSGGLADSESEAERTSKVQTWWQRPERVGRGRGIVVVDGMRVHDDWVRRVQGQE